MEQSPRNRQCLIELLCQEGIHYGSLDQPIRSRDGSVVKSPWMLDSLGISLTADGVQLAADCLLELLEKFEGRQLATYGVTAISLLTACVMRSQGRYRGLIIRKERKPYGSSKLIEGQLDPSEPIIIIDDSVSSGLAMTECCDKLEAEGLRVEGGVCLVRFGWERGYARMRQRGYHMEAVCDVYQDMMQRIDGQQYRPDNPSKVWPDFNWLDEPLPDGLPPYQVAREVIAAYLRSGQVPNPPQFLDADYDARGGCWVSLRQRDNLALRPARDGMWHFPEEKPGNTAHELVLAAIRTARHLQGEAGLATLNDCAIAVTFFPALESCHVGELDNDRYGIVVRSRERPYQMGGCLPRSPGIDNEWRQFQHARTKNAQLYPFEPFILYRHDLQKSIEADVEWPEGGSLDTRIRLWFDDPDIAGSVAQRAYQWVMAELTGKPVEGEPLASDELQEQLSAVYITLILNGRTCGCMGGRIHNLEQNLCTLAQAALNDPRFTLKPTTEVENLVVKVSLLHKPYYLGNRSPEQVMDRVILGEQALCVQQDQRTGLLLSDAAVTHNLDTNAYALEVVNKAGITRPPYYWWRYDSHSWLYDGQQAQPLRAAFTRHEPSVSLPAMSRLWADYILRQQREDGSLHYICYPFTDKLQGVTDLPHTAHAAWVLAKFQRLYSQADSVKTGMLFEYMLKHMDEDEHSIWLRGASVYTISGVALALLALCEWDDAPRSIRVKLAATLWQSIDQHGRINTRRDASETTYEMEQDYYPGQVLLALARAVQTGYTEIDTPRLQRALSYYWHRFKQKRAFGQVSGLAQALLAWSEVLQEDTQAQRAFSICDWILEYQSVKHGGFMNDHPDLAPSYMTGVYLEAIAAAAKVAQDNGESTRAQGYVQACEHGFHFLDRLVIQARDSSLLPNPDWAIGGLRTSAYNSTVRVDFVQHSLSAAMELMPWHIHFED